MDKQTDTVNTGASLLESLRHRRSVGLLGPAEPPKDLVEHVIEAATWAPNHHRTKPWRFIVLTGAARAALGEVMAASLETRMAGRGEEPAAATLDKERRKPLRAPVIVAVAAVPSREPRVNEAEEVAAVAAGVQNMLLAAQALGLGAMWRTGDAAYDPVVKHFLGLPDEAHIVAFLYLGYATAAQQPHDHTGNLAEYVTWR